MPLLAQYCTFMDILLKGIIIFEIKRSELKFDSVNNKPCQYCSSGQVTISLNTGFTTFKKWPRTLLPHIDRTEMSMKPFCK